MFTAPTDVFDRLVRQSNGQYVLTRKGSNEQWVFGNSGTTRLLQQVVDRYGRANTLNYLNGRLSQVVDRYGRMLSLTYSANWLWKVADFIGREWELVYNAQGRLERARFSIVQNENDQNTLYEVSFTYNSRGTVTRWRDRLGQ